MKNKLISEEIVSNASIKFEDENGHRIWDEENKVGGKPGTHLCTTSFKAGALFAETELQNLAIEFAESVSNSLFHFDKLLKKWHRNGDCESYTSTDLLTKFIEQSYEK